MEIGDFRGPALVTVAYVALYYVLQTYSLRLKFRLAKEYRARGERFDRYFGQDREMLAADRYQLNTLEHMPPFLILLWLHAVFVSPVGATIAGAIYVMSRVAYPFVLGRRVGGGPPMRVFPVTFTGYGVLVYLTATVIAAALG